MGSEDLAKEFYRKHKGAMDFVFQRNPEVGGAEISNSGPIEEKLDGLLQEIDHVEYIAQKLEIFNVFSATGMERAEIRHSKFLSFLLNPTSSHGLGLLPLRSFLLAVSRITPPPISSSTVALLDHSQARVNPEVSTDKKRRVDLVIEYPGSIAILIENKIDATEGMKQLKDYAEWAEGKKDWLDIKKVFLYLTPGQHPAPSDGKWSAISYDTVIAMLDNLLARSGGLMQNDVEFGLRHYRHLLASKIVPSLHPLHSEARKLYSSHPDALAYIYSQSLAPSLTNPEIVVRLAKRILNLLGNEGGLVLKGSKFVPVEWTDDALLNSMGMQKQDIFLQASVDRLGFRVIGELQPSASEGRAKLFSRLVGHFDPPHRGRGKAQKRFANDLLAELEGYDEDDEEVAFEQFKLGWAEFCRTKLQRARNVFRDVATQT